MSDLSCAKMRELAPELALDVLTGYERATAQAHLNACPQCREYVSSLTLIGDRMLTLVPGAEPPVGFEDRVLARLGMSAPPARQPRRRRWPMAFAAAAAAAVLFGLGGWAIGDIASQGASVTAGGVSHPVLRFAQLRTTDQRQVGQVFTYEGSPSWVYMSVATTTKTGTVSCELLGRDGKYVWVGSFRLADGNGSWGAQLKADPSTLLGARLLSDGGAVLATATFDSGNVYTPTGGPK
ncbi:MAG TPA: hypothetical protein VH352_02595 [Pseudonocardiaceae bacterium]|nr:hypothetical protein [Pseudonocardiaceae bacterium]